MQTKKCLQGCDRFKWIIGCGFVFSLITWSQSQPYNCTGVCAGLEDSSEPETGASTGNDDTDYSDGLSEIFNFTDSLNITLKFATPCETPNGEVTFCVEISKCETLEKVKNKKKYANYVEASRCGPKNENQKNFKVCCGKYNNFRNSSSSSSANKTTAPDAISTPIFDSSLILPQDCGKQKFLMRGRIIGGVEAALGEYPWMVRLIHKNNQGKKSYGCSGFLIHPKYVVTAAHCIHSDFSDIQGEPCSVLLGEHNVSTQIDCTPGGTICAAPTQISRINKTIVHPGYVRDSKNHHNDIALLYLNKGAHITDFVRPICLAEQNFPNVHKYYISGWGKTETAGTSPVKRKVDLAEYDRDDCIDKFKSFLQLDIVDSQICAGGEKMKDSCNGDSGGPLMKFNGTSYFAVGLVSYGVSCGMPHWPGVYTSIPYHLNWIKMQMLDITTKSPRVKKIRKKKKVET